MHSASDKPKICHVLHSLQIGGAEMLAARLARRCARDYQIIFACLDELGPLGIDLRRDGFQVSVLQRKPGFDAWCAARLGLLLRRERVDIIHAHQYTPFSYALLARWMHRSAAILFHEHGRHQPDFPRRKRIIANRLLLSRRDRIVGVGEAVRQALIDNEGLPASRVGVVYNGIDVDAIARASGLRSDVRDELGLTTDALAVVKVARLDPIKDHTTAIDSFARFAATHRNAHLLLIGDGSERAAIEQRINASAMRERIRLLGTRNDVKRLLAAADLFLLTSTSEGIPLTLIEAMAAGVPVVATRVGGVPEVVADGVTGLLAPARDVAQLAVHLDTLAKCPQLREAMGRQARQRARELFSEDEMVARYDNLYQEMLARRVPA
jgi:L-malate glycosyltransferase